MKLFPSTVVAAALLAAFGAAPLTAGAATPTYSWSTAKIGGTGFVDGMLAHVGSKGLFYARTDVGGAYRYDVTTSTWIALNDWLPPALHYAYGVDTIAVDPNNSSKFYMIGGINFGNGIDNKAVFLSSNDQGRTFSTLTLPFTTGGNEGGRQVGERLQVDPTFGSILLYGTANSTVNASNNGIWKSTDSGQHWSRLANFNALTSDGTGAGVAFIAFKPNATNGNPSQVIYAGVNTQSAANAKNLIYKSTDGGNTWAAVSSPAGTGLYPQHGQIGPDGYLYVTFARTTASNPTSAGPGDLTDGEVWKINVGGGQDQWTNITPQGSSPRPYGFGGLSVDPWRGGWLTVNTSNIYSGNGQSAETVYRSVDGGVTWSDILAHSTFDATLEPWRAAGGAVTGFGNWTNTLLDPYDSNHAFVSSGGGIWETKNLSAASTTWTSGDVGIEETAMLDLMSPTPNVWNAYPL
ncbi:MAG: exo-alpha-sialidase, partial [Massilia sp.]|nr:exo-alpha-sialidase [Massilia sp.]